MREAAPGSAASTLLNTMTTLLGHDWFRRL